MDYRYQTKSGVCSREISFTIEDGVVKNVCFLGGCSGNTQGVAALVQDMPAEEVVKRLKNIKCGFKESSCPDQLALAVEEALEQRDGPAEETPPAADSGAAG